MSTCRVCEEVYTSTIFNIRLQPVSICESCANAITIQQVTALIEGNVDEDDLAAQRKIVRECSDKLKAELNR